MALCREPVNPLYVSVAPLTSWISELCAAKASLMYMGIACPLIDTAVGFSCGYCSASTAVIDPPDTVMRTCTSPRLVTVVDPVYVPSCNLVEDEDDEDPDEEEDEEEEDEEEEGADDEDADAEPDEAAAAVVACARSARLCCILICGMNTSAATSSPSAAMDATTTETLPILFMPSSWNAVRIEQSVSNTHSGSSAT